MNFTCQSRPIHLAHLEGVDLELRAPRMKISLRNERLGWWVELWWLTDRRQWKLAYAWKVWGRDQGLELAEYLAERFKGWQQGMPSPIPGWLKQVAKSGMVVPVERIREQVRS